MSDKVFITWSQVDAWVDKLVEEVKATGIEYDTILAISRGGLIPGSMISYKLGVKNLQVLGINTREEDGSCVEHAIYQRPTELHGNVLVIDDINDSGVTFKSIHSLINSGDMDYMDANEVTYCTLVRRYSSTFNHDTIQAVDTTIDDWFVFPWDK